MKNMLMKISNIVFFLYVFMLASTLFFQSFCVQVPKIVFWYLVIFSPIYVYEVTRKDKN